MKTAVRRRFSGFLLIALLACWSGCSFYGGKAAGFGPVSDDGTSSGSSSSGGGGSGGTGILYVTIGGSSILRFTPATTVDGATAPAAPALQGSLTQLNDPRYLFLDVANDRLYVANFGGGSVLVFNNISTLSGNAPPTRAIAGANTLLSGPLQAAVDASRDLLYVADSGNGALAVFDNAATVDGNIAPLRTISGSNSGLVGISGILLDAANDRMYVSTSAPSVRVFDGISGLVGDPFPNRILSGSATGLAAPRSLALDGADQLYVVDGNRILRFANASTIDGNTAPTAIVEGTSTSLSAPGQGLFESGSGSFYVANTGAASITVYDGFATALGNIFPNRKVTGAATLLASPQGLAVDATR